MAANHLFHKYGTLCVILIMFVFSLFIFGCVAGQSIQHTYSPEPPKTTVGSGKDVSIEVIDERSYVKSGDKGPEYIGHYRAGFGNTWDVTTTGKIPLAEQFKNDLQKELAALGFNVSSSQRRLKVEIIDYNFDTYLNGRFWYEILVEVFDSDNLLAQQTIKDSHVIRGNVWTGAKSAFEKEVPKLYASVIEKIVRDNPDVLGALNS